MDWSGQSFHYTQFVKRGSGTLETISLRDLTHHPRYKNSPALRSFWTQPQDKDGRLRPVYFGYVPILLRGQKSVNGLSRKADVSRLIARLKSLGLSASSSILLNQGDFYLFLNPHALRMSPDPQYPTWCERVALHLAEGISIDRTIYRSDTVYPMPGMPCADGSFTTPIGILDLEYSDQYVMTLCEQPRRWYRATKVPTVFDAEMLHPHRSPLRPALRTGFPDGVKALLQAEHKTNDLNAVCFTVALAVKDHGGIPRDALLLMQSISGIEHISTEEREWITERAFRYQFGARAFARRFPAFAPKIQAEKSPYLVIERAWLDRLALVEHVATHRLFAKLLLAYHDYPRAVIPIPDDASGRSGKKALQNLESLGIILIHGNEVSLQFDFTAKTSRYVRIPADWLSQALISGPAIRLFHAILTSSLHRKNNQGLWTTVKIPTLAKRLQLTERSLYAHLRKLRESGLDIDTKLHIHNQDFQLQSPGNSAPEQGVPATNESISISMDKRLQKSSSAHARISRNEESLLREQASMPSGSHSRTSAGQREPLLPWSGCRRKDKRALMPLKRPSCYRTPIAFDCSVCRLTERSKIIYHFFVNEVSKGWRMTCG